jgi:NADH-quinone oxidoreductase subunit N
MDFFLLFSTDFRSLLPESFLVTATALLLVYGVVYSTSTEKAYPVLVPNLTGLGGLVLFFTAFLIIENPVETGKLFYNSFLIDPVTTSMKLLTIGAGTATIFLGKPYLRAQKIGGFEYLILILLATTGFLFLISSYDLVTAFLSLELQSFCLYVLAAGKRRSEFSTEAGLKYFILGAFSSGLLLFGTSLVYGFTGTTNLEDLFTVLACLPFLSGGPKIAPLLGLLFLIAGFLFKLTAAPFHMWGPDVYEGAPTAVTAFFATTPKIPVFAFFLRLLLVGAYDLVPFWKGLLIVSGIASLAISSFSALGEGKLKRLLAFSSIGHVGILLLGLSCGSFEGTQATFIYLVVYTAMSLNLFAALLSFDAPNKGNEWQINLSYLHVQDLHRLGTSNPALALNLTLALFSLAGVPPLAGFASKFYVFFSLLSASLPGAALFVVLSSVLSSFYYLRLIKIMYFEPSSSIWVFHQPPSREGSLILGISLAFLVLFFLSPGQLFYGTQVLGLVLLP